MLIESPAFDNFDLQIFKSRGTVRYKDLPVHKPMSISVKEKDFPIKIQEIIGVSINGEDINKDIIDIAKHYGFAVRFPLLYQVQLFPEDLNKDVVYNWYTTTGTLTSQPTDGSYGFHKYGQFETIEDVIKQIQKL